MSYSNNIKITEIEPIYDSTNSRSEWRFEPNKIYSTNVLIANVGVDQATASRYNRLSGVGGMFDNVMLYDGNVELQMTQLCGFWSGWKQSRKSNANLKDKAPMLIGNERGSRFEGQDAGSGNAGGTNAGKSVRNDVIIPGNQLSSKTGKATMAANEFLPILDAMPYLDTSIFKNLRLIVEYNAEAVVRENQAETLTTLRPLLIVEEVVNPAQVAAAQGKMGDIIYDNVETDRALLPAVVPTANGPGANAQSFSYHVNGYTNKKVGKMLIWKQSQTGLNYSAGGTAGDYQNGAFDSMGLFRERTQIRVNGQNVFAKNGISKSNQRLARLVDSWGSGGLATFANGLAPITLADANPRNVYREGGNAAVGFMDWFGCDLGYQEVQDFQVEFERSGIANLAADNTNVVAETAKSKYNAPYKLIMFALIQKAIIMDGKGGYNVRYA